MFARNDQRRVKMIRGLVLHLLWLAGNGESLNPNNPFAMSRTILVSALEQLQQLPPIPEMNAAARYLEEKSYLEVTWAKDGTGYFESVKLTANGMDLVEGARTDVGVIVPRLN